MISICIIVRNEEKNISECLKKLAPYNYEIIVVDTGSTDNTKQEAFKYTDKVFDFVWCDDFSAARNYAISKANHEYILMIDSDEFLIEMDKVELENLIKKHPHCIGRIKRNNKFAREDMGFCSTERINRLFAKNLYFYEGIIHEQIVAKNGEDYKTYHVPVSVEHSGYEGGKAERKSKAERNIQLLKKVLKDNGDTPYILYQLAKGYYYGEDFVHAVKYFGQAMEYDLDPRLEYVCDMVEMYGYALIHSDNIEHALLLEGIYDTFCYSADFVFMMGFVYMQNNMFDKAVEQFLKAATYQESKVEGVNSYLAYYNAGVIMECLNEKKKACEYYSKSGDYQPAIDGKQRCQSL